MYRYFHKWGVPATLSLVEECLSITSLLYPSQTLRAFREGETQELVSSDAMTRGMDVEGVRNVINFHTSAHIKIYIHGASRTSRAGQGGHCFMQREGYQWSFLCEIPLCSSQEERLGLVSRPAIWMTTASERKLKGSVESETYRKRKNVVVFNPGKMEGIAFHLSSFLDKLWICSLTNEANGSRKYEISVFFQSRQMRDFNQGSRTQQARIRKSFVSWFDHVPKVGIHLPNAERVIWISLSKYLLLVAFEDEAPEDSNDNVLFGAKASESFTLHSLSSSLIVSSIFVARYLITLTNCGGATSVINLAKREFAILYLSVARLNGVEEKT
ncbi:hypothetical protein RJ639_006034 [Escallonia herrerae]|uniref:Helicase C-terminal domain-containing protein n=1 Tax=Escallonia herrerae TaxID=1293975 RepID=A0AA89AYK4_9ASTE|nr:hypothetical protein RJ639_006034 [Escallonia herrerae]